MPRGQAGQALAGRALYLTRDPAVDDERRELTGVPDELAFATKPQLAAMMLERTREAGMPARQVAADEVYGGHDLRTRVRELGYDYAVAVPAIHRVTTSAGCFAATALRATGELSFYRCHSTARAGLADLVAVVCTRWRIEVGHRWYWSSCFAFSWLCSLFLVGLLFWLCPAGAGVEAGRAGPALAWLAHLLVVCGDDPVPGSGGVAGGDPAAVDPVVDGGGGHAQLGGQAGDGPLARWQGCEHGGAAFALAADAALGDQGADLLVAEPAGPLGRPESLGVDDVGALPVVTSRGGELGDAGEEGGVILPVAAVRPGAGASARATAGWLRSSRPISTGSASRNGSAKGSPAPARDRDRHGPGRTPRTGRRVREASR